MQHRQYRKPLDDIEKQLTESRKKRAEYEKTVKLLSLVDKTPNIANIKLNTKAVLRVRHILHIQSMKYHPLRHLRRL